MTGIEAARAIRRACALVALFVLAGVVSATAESVDESRGFQFAFGPSGSFTDGDPLVGVYGAVRLPSETAWAIGLDAFGEYGRERVDNVTTEDYRVAGMLAVDREVTDVIDVPEKLSLQLGGRLGVLVERDESSGESRSEPYPVAGIYGSAAWHFAPTTAVESRLSVDLGDGARLGLALGVRFGR